MLPEKLTRRLPVAVPGAAEACTRVGALLAFAGLQLHYAPDGHAAQPPSDVWIAFESRWGPMRLAPLAAEGRPLAPVGAGGRADALGLASMLQSSEPLVLALERAFDSTLRPVSLHAGPGSDASVFLIATDNGYRARLSLPAATARQLPAAAMTSLPQWAHALRMDTRVDLGAARLGADEWAALEPGDVLLCPGAFSDRWRARVSMAGGWPAIGVLFRAASLDLHFHPEESANMPDGQTATAQAAESPWSGLPVRVRFELPGIRVPLGALAGLQPGAVVPIAEHASGVTIELFSDTHLIGRGELVALGDGYGVRLVEFAPGVR